MEVSVDLSRDAHVARCLTQVDVLRLEIERERMSRQTAEAAVNVLKKEKSSAENKLQTWRTKAEENAALLTKTRNELDYQRRSLELCQQQLRYARQQLDDRDIMFQSEKQRLHQSFAAELKQTLDHTTLELKQQQQAIVCEMKQAYAVELQSAAQKERRLWQLTVEDEVTLQLSQFEKVMTATACMFDRKHYVALDKLKVADARVQSIKASLHLDARKEDFEKESQALSAKVLELTAALDEKTKALVESKAELTASQAALLRCQSNREEAIQTSQNLYESLQGKDTVLRKKEERLLACEAEIDKLKRTLSTVEKESSEALSSYKARHSKRIQKHYAKWEAEARRKIERVKADCDLKLKEAIEKLKVTEEELKLEQDARDMLAEALDQAEAKFTDVSARLELSTRRSTAITSPQSELERIYVKQRKDTELFTDEFRRKDEELVRMKKVHSKRMTEIEHTYNAWRDRLISESNYMKAWLEKMRLEEAGDR